MNGADLLRHYQHLGLTPVPLKSRSKKPLVKWGTGCSKARCPAMAKGSRCVSAAAALNPLSPLSSRFPRSLCGSVEPQCGIVRALCARYVGVPQLWQQPVTCPPKRSPV